MSNLEVFTIEAGPHNIIPSITKIFSMSQTSSMLYVSLPRGFFPGLTPFEVVEVKDDMPNPTDIIMDCKWVPGRCWVDIPFDSLNHSEGQHLYRIAFVDTCMHDVISYLYFSYILQNDNPDKPYVYMNKEGCSCETSNS